MKKRNVIIIGAGKIAALFDTPKSNKILTHAHAFSISEHFELIGFYDSKYESAVKASEIWKCKAFEKMEDALREADIVCCCVPDEYHYEMLVEIAQYPVELVIAEKPIAIMIDDAVKIKELFTKKNIPILVNYSRRYIKEYRDLKQQISNMGKFLKGTAYYGKGIIHNGSHVLDLISFLLDTEQIVKRVSNPIGDFFENDQSCDAEIEIGNGIFNMVAIDCRVVTVFEIDLFFERARVKILDGGSRIEIYSIEESGDYAGYYNFMMLNAIDVDYSGAMLGIVDNAYDFLQGKAFLFCDINEGIKVMRTCNSIKEMING